MATRIRTLNFLPEIFKTPTNAQFLKATLDQIVAQPNTKKIQGYVGGDFGPGINPNDYYTISYIYNKLVSYSKINEYNLYVFNDYITNFINNISGKYNR